MTEGHLAHPSGTVVVYPEPELHNIPTATLRAELARLLTITADHLMYLAAVWRELENRGEDLSPLRTGLAAYLPLIASHQLCAEAVIRFAGNQTLLRAVATLPLQEQERLAQGGMVPVLCVDERGEFAPRETPAHALTAAQARIVFDAGKVRDLDEQRSIIDSVRMKRANRGSKKTIQTDKIRIDRVKREIRVGKVRLTVPEILSALGEMFPLSVAPEGETKQYWFYLTEEEHRALRIRAAETGMSGSKLVHIAASAAGILER